MRTEDYDHTQSDSWKQKEIEYSFHLHARCLACIAFHEQTKPCTHARLTCLFIVERAEKSTE